MCVTEKQKLKNTDYPLVARILQGPCEQVSKVFLMEKDQVEEVTYDVSPLLVGWSVLRWVGIWLGYLQLGYSLTFLAKGHAPFCCHSSILGFLEAISRENERRG